MPTLGQVGLIHGYTGFWAKLIQLVTASDYNHVVIAIDTTHCISAEHPRARVRLISDYDDCEVVWSKIPLTLPQQIRILRWCRKHLGTRYNWLDFFAIGLARITGRQTPAWLRRRLASTDSLQCAQFADQALQAAGIRVFEDGRPDGAVYPGSFGRWFVLNGWATRP